MINILIHYNGITNEEFEFDSYISLDFMYTGNSNEWVLDVYAGNSEYNCELEYTCIFKANKSLTHEEVIRIFETVILFRLYPEYTPTYDYEELSFYEIADI